MLTPEDKAHETIDALLTRADSVIQDGNQINLFASRGVVVRHFILEPSHGLANYPFYTDGNVAGVIAAKQI